MSSELDATIRLSHKNREIIANHAVEDMLKKSIDVHSVTENDHPEVALKKLYTLQILALPVYSGDGSRKFKGFIDILDLVTFLMRIVHAHKKHAAPDAQDWQKVLETEAMWHNAKCGMIIKDFEHSQENCLYLSSDVKTSSLIPAIRFLKSSSRITVFNSPNDLSLAGIITQGTLVRYLYTILDHSDPFFSQVVGVLRSSPTEVHLINQNKTVGEAFEQCRLHCTSGVGMVDDQGRLVGNVSASDMRNLKNHTIDDIVRFCSKPCAWLKVYAAKECYPMPISVLPDAAIKDVLDLFVSTRMHRVYTIDQGKKPLSVILLSDIISLIDSNLQK